MLSLSYLKNCHIMSNPSSPQPKSLSIVRSILDKIQDNDADGISHDLSLLPLANISLDKSDTLISWFLKKCMEHSNTEISRLIIEIFDLNRIGCDPLPSLTQLFLNSYITHEILCFAMSCFPEKRPLDLFIDLINMHDDISSLKAAVHICAVFPDISSEDWTLLHRLTNYDDDDDDDCKYLMLRAFFESKIAETETNISPPSWVRNFPKENIPSFPDTFPNVKEAIGLLLADLEKQKMIFISDATNETVDVVNDNELKDQLISQYSISTATEKIQILSAVTHIEPFDDTVIFREFGPVNSLYSVTDIIPDSNHVCTKFGGCRMLTCTEFENMYIDGEEIDIMAIDEYNDNIEYSSLVFNSGDTNTPIIENIQVTTVGSSSIEYEWFRGSCDVCLKRILHKHHAIRQPLRCGGWRGCYCSFDCLKEHVFDPIVAVMVGRIQEQLNVIGIRDRS